MTLVLKALKQQSKEIVSEHFGPFRRTLEVVIHVFVTLENYYLKAQIHEFLSPSESILHLPHVSLISVKPGEETFYVYVLKIQNHRYLLKTRISNVMADNGKLARILNFNGKNLVFGSKLSPEFEHLEVVEETDPVLIVPSNQSFPSPLLSIPNLLAPQRILPLKKYGIHSK